MSDPKNEHQHTKHDSSHNSMPVPFSTLIISLASSALMAMGLEKNPQTDQIEKDMQMARINIDMLEMLKAKTKNNLDADEQKLLDTILADLQIKFVHQSKR